MPRAKPPQFNAQFVEWLEELKNDQDKEGNRYMAYNKALKSLKNYKKEFATPRDLVEVPHIGEKIIAILEKRLRESGGPQPVQAAPAARARPLKRAATDIDREPPPQAKRRTVSAAALPVHAPATQPATRFPAGNDDPFQFWYLDGKKRVRNRVDAQISSFMLLDDGSQLLRVNVVYQTSQANHPLAAQLYNHECQGSTMVAEMREDTAEPFPTCPGFTSASTPAPAPAPAPAKPSLLSALLAEETRQKTLQKTTDPSRQLPTYLQKAPNAVASGSRSNADNSDMRQAAAARSYGSLSQMSRASSPPASRTPSTSPVRPPPPRALARAATTAGASSSSSASALQRTASAPLPSHNRPRLSHAVPGLPPVEHPSRYAPQTTFPDFQPRIFRAGEYTVHLLLDKGEKSGKNPEAIADALRANGVSAERRKLELGDVAWVARHRQDNFECMLDVILERKRLDDLVASIINKDKRFHEQKFRLHRSSMSRVLYLVEAYNVKENRDTFDAMISTAISSTQVVDGFMVKETKNINDTIAYLTGLTEELVRMHQTTDLYVIPTQHVRPHSYMELQTHLRKKYPTQCFVTSFADFNKLNTKSGHTTVRDTWTHMLLCIKGMSAEKAGAVVARWETPRAMWEAFRDAQIQEQIARAREAEEEAATVAGPSKGKGRKKKSTVPEARMMLQGVGGAEGGVRAIGQALSSKVYHIMTAPEYED